MSSAKIVYTGANPIGGSGTLFEGKKFWLSYNIPQRSKFRELIQSNGGIVVPLEKDADIKLVDHAKRDVPPDTFSYQYVERSVWNGRLESLEAHRAGPLEHRPRPVGASHIPTRGHRTPFTAEDDRILLEWVRHYEEQGLAAAGNKIYEMLAEKHPQHTFQSWRNRYVKRLRDQIRRPVLPSSTAQRVRSHQGAGRTVSNESVSSEGVPTREQSTIPDGDELAKPIRKNRTESGSREPSDGAPPPTRMERLIPPQNAPSTPLAQREDPLPQRPLRSPSFQPQTPSVPEKVSSDVQATPPAAYWQRTSVPSWDTRGTPSKDAEPTEGQRIRKRKRLSADDVSENPTFNIDRQPDPKRRATGFISTAIPSTPVQPPVETEKERRNASPETTDDETESEERFETAPQYKDTQDLLTGPTQPDDNLLLELPFLPSSPSEDKRNGHDNENEIVRQIDEWIDSRLRTGKAQNEQQAIEAMRCTSMDPDLADVVLSHLVAGKGIPQHMRGVWTPEDDKCLEGTNARDIARLMDKHGTELYNTRFKYLQIARAAGA